MGMKFIVKEGFKFYLLICQYCVFISNQNLCFGFFFFNDFHGSAEGMSLASTNSLQKINKINE